MATTPYMSLILPVPGDGGTRGPEYASMQNTALGVVDSHDHTSGKGLPVPTAGININDDLDINGYNLNAGKSLRLEDQTATLVGALDRRSLYAVNGDLYYNNASGTPIQITTGGTFNPVAGNGFLGDYQSSGAQALYTTATSTYTFNTPSAVRADMDFGNITQAAATVTQTYTPTAGKAVQFSNSGTVIRWRNTTDSTDILSWTYSTAEMTLGGTIFATGGYKVVLGQYYVTPSASVVSLQPVGSQANPTVLFRYVAPYAGYFRALTCVEAAATTIVPASSSIIFFIQKNGVTSGLTSGASTGQYKGYATFSRAPANAFVAGDEISVVYSTTGSYSQTLKYHVALVVEH